MFSLFLYYYWTLHLKIMIYVEKSPRRKNNNQINENTNSQKLQFNLFIYSRKKNSICFCVSKVFLKKFEFFLFFILN